VNYYWTNCPNCGCEVAVNVSSNAEGLAGSLRRWSYDRTINDGRPLRIPGAGSTDGGIVVECVCGQALSLSAKPDAVGSPR
jgi:hypothetical protein